MELNQNIPLPEDFILDITGIPGSSSDVCLIAIEHYKQFINSQNILVRQISAAMIGNLTEYYNLSNKGSLNFELALPHLSEMANFMDSKNTPQMDIESTARIKSFYSTYEKLLLECSELLEHGKALPTSSLAYDLIATRDVLYPRYQLRLEPQAFYKHVYGLILEYMEHIDDLSEEDSRYGFEEIPPHKQIEISRPKKFNFIPDETYVIPDKDFIDFAFEIKNIPEIYRYLTSLPPNMGSADIKSDIEQIKKNPKSTEITSLPLVKAIKNQLRKENLLEFRNSLEEDLLSIMVNPKMLKEYKELSAEDFIYIYKQRLAPYQRDFARIIEYIDQTISSGNYDFRLNFSNFIKEGTMSEQLVDDLLTRQLSKQYNSLKLKLALIAETDLETFDQLFEEASQITYFSRCAKDYMRNPKETGYQSFHIIVRTPFGRYEKQFRTAAQNDFAEHGHASHSATYKPYEKENFHRLKIFQPLMPKRNENGDIITPITLEPLDFGSAVKAYYHQDFSFFANGLTFEEFQAEHAEDFDIAMFELSNSNTSEGMLDRIAKAFSSLKPFEFFMSFANRRFIEKTQNTNLNNLHSGGKNYSNLDNMNERKNIDDYNYKSLDEK